MPVSLVRFRPWAPHSALERSRRRTGLRQEKRPARPAAHRPREWLLADLDLDDFLRRRALLALDDVELDLLTLGEGLVALGLDGGVMDEAVLLTIGPGDEPETLFRVEPLDGTLSPHVPLLLV